MNENNKIFNETLGNFMSVFASGGAIRHFVDLGFTIDEIEANLDFPLPRDNIAKIIYQYYLDSGRVLLSEPSRQIEKVSYKKSQNSLGRVSFNRVVEKISVDNEEYVKCNFGKEIYQKGSIESLNNVSAKQLKHLNELPWPLQEVWVKKDLISI